MLKVMAKPIVLTILDGWGYRAETHGNAIAQARKPTYDALLRDYPNTLLRASEHFVVVRNVRAKALTYLEAKTPLEAKTTIRQTRHKASCWFEVYGTAEQG
jgi:hypothetical protein